MANEYELTIDVDASAGRGVGGGGRRDLGAALVPEVRRRARWMATSARCGAPTARSWWSASSTATTRSAATPTRSSPARRFGRIWRVSRCFAHGDGSTIVWHTRATFLDEAIDTEERLGASQRDGLERLKALCEAPAG